MLAAVAALVGAVLRSWPRSAMWLDEAQSVSFASLPLTRIPGALRQDGAPPLYYLLLHVWISVFGDGDVAVRSLSVVLSLAGMLVLGFVVSRWMGRRAGLAAVVLVACNPFAARYGSEARMYALVMLEVAIGFGLVLRMVQRVRRSTGVALAVDVAALLYTHYWALYLLAAATLGCGAAIWFSGGDPARRRAWWAVVIAFGSGGILWLPWLPTFRFQSRHTATPWSRPASLAGALDAAGFRFAGVGALVPAFAVAVTVLIVAAIVLRRPRSTPLPIPPVALLGVTLGCAVLAIVGGALSHSAYTARYTSVMFPLAMAVAAAGVASIRNARVGVGVLVVTGLLGVGLAVREIRTERTRAGAIARVIEAEAKPDDVVVYCPDQLGPATSRLLRRAGLRASEWSYPTVSRPERVNWIDYVARYKGARPRPFVRRITAANPQSTIWFVWSGTYPPTQQACTDLFNELRRDRPSARLRIGDDPSIADHGALWELPPPDTGWDGRVALRP